MQERLGLQEEALELSEEPGAPGQHRGTEDLALP
jgi:hypothetical protein